MEEKVIVTIAKDGTVTLDLEGFNGVVCKDITAAIQKRLGGTTLESRDKPAMYNEIDALKQKVYNR